MTEYASQVALPFLSRTVLETRQERVAPTANPLSARLTRESISRTRTPNSATLKSRSLPMGQLKKQSFASSATSIRITCDCLTANPRLRISDLYCRSLTLQKPTTNRITYRHLAASQMIKLPILEMQVPQRHAFYECDVLFQHTPTRRVSAQSRQTTKPPTAKVLYTCHNARTSSVSS